MEKLVPGVGGLRVGLGRGVCFSIAWSFILFFFFFSASMFTTQVGKQAARADLQIPDRDF